MRRLYTHFFDDGEPTPEDPDLMVGTQPISVRLPFFWHHIRLENNRLTQTHQLGSIIYVWMIHIFLLGLFPSSGVVGMASDFLFHSVLYSTSSAFNSIHFPHISFTFDFPPGFLSSFLSVSFVVLVHNLNISFFSARAVFPLYTGSMSVALSLHLICHWCHFYWSSHVFVADVIFLRDSTHPPQHPHLFDLQSPLLSFFLLPMQVSAPYTDAGPIGKPRQPDIAIIIWNETLKCSSALYVYVLPTGDIHGVWRGSGKAV